MFVMSTLGGFPQLRFVRSVEVGCAKLAAYIVIRACCILVDRSQHASKVEKCPGRDSARANVKSMSSDPLCLSRRATGPM